MRGFSHDRESVHFIAKHIKSAGIVSTKDSIIRLTRKEGILFIMRVCLIDRRKYFENCSVWRSTLPGVAFSR
ncbi:glycerol-3-phosphate responsive antiterminator [Oceanobacillus alkalisoli]|uniref:glycerol-3-phosphate responsive antiterminator n=1 Tax=Oceanobacillus alkalisoli TaxID=2925113 RepID=UPI0034D96BBB